MGNKIKENIIYHIENKMIMSIERNRYETNFHKGFPIKVTDDFLCMTNIIDFYDEGYILLKMGNISDAYSKESDSYYEKICICERLQEKALQCPMKNLKNYETVFQDLNDYTGYITIHCENETDKCNYFLGKIKKIKSNGVEFMSVDVNGEFFEELDFILYEDITMIAIGDHYAKMFYKYKVIGQGDGSIVLTTKN